MLELSDDFRMLREFEAASKVYDMGGLLIANADNPPVARTIIRAITIANESLTECRIEGLPNKITLESDMMFDDVINVTMEGIWDAISNFFKRIRDWIRSMWKKFKAIFKNSKSNYDSKDVKEWRKQIEKYSDVKFSIKIDTDDEFVISDGKTFDKKDILSFKTVVEKIVDTSHIGLNDDVSRAFDTYAETFNKFINDVSEQGKIASSTVLHVDTFFEELSALLKMKTNQNINIHIDDTLISTIGPRITISELNNVFDELSKKLEIVDDNNQAFGKNLSHTEFRNYDEDNLTIFTKHPTYRLTIPSIKTDDVDASYELPNTTYDRFVLIKDILEYVVNSHSDSLRTITDMRSVLEKDIDLLFKTAIKINAIAMDQINKDKENLNKLNIIYARNVNGKKELLARTARSQKGYMEYMNFVKGTALPMIQSLTKYNIAYTLLTNRVSSFISLTNKAGNDSIYKYLIKH